MNSPLNTLVAIPNLNGADKIADSVKSTLSQTKKCRVLVIDNASTDNSIELLEKLEGIEYISNSVNNGFAGAVNQGIKHAIENDYKFVALLNNDAVADKDWLKHLMQEMDDDRIAAVAPLMLYSDKVTIDSAGEFIDHKGLAGSRYRKELKSSIELNNTEEILAASGGASLYRVSALKDTGLFDEKFFAYYEDVDLSLRLRHKGYKVKFNPKSIVYHEVGSTSSKMGGFTTYHSFKNMPLLITKNLPLKNVSIWVSFVVFYHLILLNKLRKGYFKSAIKGYAHYVKLIPYALSQRRKILANSKLSSNEINQWVELYEQNSN